MRWNDDRILNPYTHKIKLTFTQNQTNKYTALKEKICRKGKIKRINFVVKSFCLLFCIVSFCLLFITSKWPAYGRLVIWFNLINQSQTCTHTLSLWNHSAEGNKLAFVWDHYNIPTDYRCLLVLANIYSLLSDPE